MTEQMRYLLLYMEKRHDFAKKHIDKLGVFGWEVFNRMWDNLGNHLNTLGPFKKIKQWKQVLYKVFYNYNFII